MRPSFVANDNTGVSGAAFQVDGTQLSRQGWLCDYTRTVPCANRLSTLRYPDRAATPTAPTPSA